MTDEHARCNTWVRVADDLPEPGDEVVIYLVTTADYEFAQFDAERSMWVLRDGTEEPMRDDLGHLTVTWWMEPHVPSNVWPGDGFSSTSMPEGY